jgi:hypothetical protein
MSVISLGRPLRVLQRASQGSRTPAEERAIGTPVTCVLAARGNTQFLTAFFCRARKISGVTMGRTNLKFAHTRDHRRHAVPTRRLHWKPRSASAPRAPSRQFNSAFASGEFAPSPRDGSAWILWRSVGLASDLVVLIVASPFLAVWGGWRMVRRLFGGAR